MIATSAAYDLAIKATARKIRGRVEVTWVDSDIDPTIVCTANDTNRINEAAEVPSGNENLQHAADGTLVPTLRWAHLDQDIRADGMYHPFPGTVPLSVDYQTGWWGAVPCNSLGYWEPELTTTATTTTGTTTTGTTTTGTTTTCTTTTAAPMVNPVLTIDFAARAINALLVVGEEIYNEYPVSFTVRIYNPAGGLIHTETVTDEVGTDWNREGVVWRKTLEELPILFSCGSMELEIVRWSRGSRVAKIVEFYTSIVETYTDDDILNISLTEENLVADGSLPVGNISANELDIKLQNVEDRFFVGNTGSPIYEMLKRNRRIRAWLGCVLPPFNLNPALETVEWIPLGVFWSGDWQADELGTYVSTSARDRMELLRKSKFETSDVYENITLYELAETVMEDARLKMPDMVYSIDASYQDYVLRYSWFEKETYFECIRKICESRQGFVYCDRYGEVLITA